MPTILLAEDDPDDALLMARALGKLIADTATAHGVHVVTDGEMATEYLLGTGPYADRDHHPFPDLVILDLHMPRRSGLEVLAWLRAQPIIGLLPTVVLTSSREAADMDRASELGVDSYLTKPSTAQGYDAVARALSRYWLESDEAESAGP